RSVAKPVPRPRDDRPALRTLAPLQLGLEIETGLVEPAYELVQHIVVGARTGGRSGRHPAQLRLQALAKIVGHENLLRVTSEAPPRRASGRCTSRRWAFRSWSRAAPSRACQGSAASG